MNPDLRVFLLITKISINPNFRFQGMLKFKSKTSCWFGEKKIARDTATQSA